ncbi:hypothetical protein AMIS_60420 [Actinoplanes missouriensis 431]|uniref:SUKH-4 immunity protein of toxin-antitoxin system n=1 Tax=Actinoplanes missouriensis (strain ATCC 14538 / DSM 43046 / CBS 188.64 / JCM 3121 / NBRC 102363 / NCIMB 12654 / NRRL B-3342 / UNCC 431) TaxID=512565 RepID=I0HE25_ACTM4|nr:SUKH-4 family immunity protein [Actinoplanes missouriensis]BAL91262.1 hypothetical protein AMIS_60420 [Actinoplanes missouriensis 431]
MITKTRRLPSVDARDLEGWAGVGNVLRLTPATVARWRVPEQARTLLVDVGLPRLDTRFIPDPQHGDEPALPTMYVIGREQITPNHVHEAGCTECGYFGLREGSGEVVYRWLRHDGDLLVNSSLQHFLYFLHKQGAASVRYEGVNEEKMMRLYERVVARLEARDPLALGDESSFWKARFSRLWG